MKRNDWVVSNIPEDFLIEEVLCGEMLHNYGDRTLLSSLSLDICSPEKSVLDWSGIRPQFCNM